MVGKKLPLPSGFKAFVASIRCTEASTDPEMLDVPRRSFVDEQAIKEVGDIIVWSRHNVHAEFSNVN